MVVKLFEQSDMNYRESIYLIAVVLKMLTTLLGLTVIPFMIGEDLTTNIFKAMTYSSYILVVMSFFAYPYFSKKELWRLVILVTITVIGSIFSHNDLMLTLLYIYGANNIDIEKILSKLSKIYIFLFIFIVFASVFGLIENWDFFANTNRPRWGLGFSYPTHTSSILFTAVLLFCYFRKEKLTLFEICGIEAINLLVFEYTDSRAGVALSLLIPVVFYLIKILKNNTSVLSVEKLLCFAFPVCIIVIFLITILYNGSGILAKINSLLSNRLFYSKKAIEMYGIHLFGKKIPWVGNGGIGHTRIQMTVEYNYVDSAFIKLLLEQGILVWTVVMLSWTHLSFRAYASGNRYLLYTLAFIAVYSMIEQWLMNIGANPFLLFIAYYLYQPSPNQNPSQVESVFKQVISNS